MNNTIQHNNNNINKNKPFMRQQYLNKIKRAKYYNDCKKKNKYLMYLLINTLFVISFYLLIQIAYLEFPTTCQFNRSIKYKFKVN